MNRKKEMKKKKTLIIKGGIYLNFVFTITITIITITVIVIVAIITIIVILIINLFGEKNTIILVYSGI
jgi:hypothetical protein